MKSRLISLVALVTVVTLVTIFAIFGKILHFRIVQSCPIEIPQTEKVSYGNKGLRSSHRGHSGTGKKEKREGGISTDSDGLQRDKILRSMKEDYREPTEQQLKENLVKPEGFDIQPPLKFLKEYKNPCWKANGKLLCLPYAYIIGFRKCATTDLWSRLTENLAKVKSLPDKEAQWWNQRRYDMPLSKFAAMYGAMMKGKEDRKTVFIDASPTTVWDQYYHVRMREDRMRRISKTPSLPKILNAHRIKKYTPKAKIIIMMRNPTDSVYSEHNYYGGSFNTTKKFVKSPYRFHYRTAEMVGMYRDCFKRYPIRSCVYDPNLIVEGDIAEVRLNNYWYPTYISDWLRVFPKEQLMFIKTEEYAANGTKTVKDVLKFLGIESPSPAEVNRIGHVAHRNTKEEYSTPDLKPIMPETRKMLDDIFRPFRQALAQFLKDPKWLWKEKDYLYHQ